jgi:hypothetical protein
MNVNIYKIGSDNILAVCQLPGEEFPECTVHIMFVLLAVRRSLHYVYSDRVDMFYYH